MLNTAVKYKQSIINFYLFNDIILKIIINLIEILSLMTFFV